MVFHQQESQELEHHYKNPANEIVVLYGREENGLSQVLQGFLKNKSYFYYRSRSCSSKLQLQLFYDEIREDLPKGMRFNAQYPDILSAMLSVTCAKRIIVIDAFEHLLKAEPAFMDVLVSTIHNKWNNQSVLFLLVSEDVTWVNREMVRTLGSNAYEISSVIPLKDASYRELTSHFTAYDFVSKVMLYSIFGRHCGSYSRLDPNATLQENICRTVLTKGGYFYEKSKRILPAECREPVVYHTLLYALAGKQKLNDLHKLTGYDRAKISVYLKNLTEYGLVEKIESFDAPGHDNQQKGLYRISDPFAAFYFHFIYPHESKLHVLEPERFYRRYIEPSLRSYACSAYVDVCKEYLLTLQNNNELDRSFADLSTWYGKVGTIDIVSQNDDGQTLICYCNFDKNKMSYADYEWNRYCMSQAKMKSDILYLFSQSSFEEKIKEEVMSDPSVVLIEGDWD